MSLRTLPRVLGAVATLAAVIGVSVIVPTPASAAGSRDAIVSIATNELGGTRFKPYYDSERVAWCAEFARWVWSHGGVDDLAGLNSYAQSFKEYGEDRGTYHSRSSSYTPQPGDAVVFDWNHVASDDHPIDHIALITSASSSKIYTIGGNQGGGNGVVSRGEYSRTDGDVIGYVEPADLKKVEASMAPALAYDKGDSMQIYRWASNDKTFGRASDYESGAFSLEAVGDRVASGDVNGDGKDDIVMAYQRSDGTFAFYVWRNGNSAAQVFWTSGSFNLDKVGGRLVVDDFDGDGKAEPAMVYDKGDGTMRIYRWTSTGSTFARASDYDSGAFALAAVGNRVASGDVNGDGKADIVMAYQRADGTFAYYVWRNGNLPAQVWFESGSYNLDNVAGRLVVDDFNGDGKAEPAMAYDQGDGTMRIYRWTSTGSAFSRASDYDSGAFALSAVGDRMASGDVNGDGKADTVMAYQRADGTFAYYTWFNGNSAAQVWYTSGSFNLNNVGNRLVLGNW